MMDAEMKYVRGLFENKKFMKHIIDVRSRGLVNTVAKNPHASAEMRQMGYNFYRMDKKHNFLAHEVIFRAYCGSIALAPTNSQELALAYGNRSEFLFHLKKYEECMLDIDRALSIFIPDALSNELLDRRACCKTALESSKTTELPGHDKINKDKEANRPWKLIDIFKSVDVRYTEKHGRQLVANQDFTPGQVIFAEKIYASCLDSKNSHTHCSHCMTFCWSAVPCDNCNWAMFCSERCKKRASEKYHHIECPIITLMNNSPNFYGDHIRLTLRCIIIAIKEAGSIEKLKEQTRLIDQSKDMCWQGVKHKGKFIENKFSILYGFSSERLSDSLIEKNREEIMLLLLSLTKLIPVLKKNIRFQDIKNLKNDSDIIFFGSLITKILKIQVQRSYAYLRSTSEKKCQFSKKPSQCMVDECCIVKGPCFAPVSTFMNHSCYPNASVCYTKDQRIVIYAVHPIKKNTEILESYCGTFDVQYQVVRQGILDKYEIFCDCPACKHNWLPYFKLPESNWYSMMDKLKCREKKILREYESLLLCEPVDEDHIDGAVEKLSDCISNIFREGKKPSLH